MDDIEIIKEIIEKQTTILEKMTSTMQHIYGILEMRDTARGLTLHAAEQDTQEALVQEILDWWWEQFTKNGLSYNKFKRFLRERLVR